MGLVNSSCRWPVSDDAPYFFCGEPEADMIGRIPYCPYHSLMARGSKSAPRMGFAAQAAA
jgi:hypothetical protein